jgi:hypothetical protein
LYPPAVNKGPLRNRWQPIADEIEARTGITPDAFALSVYDALFVVQLALQHPKPPKNFDRFKAVFVDEADHYRAITGSTTRSTLPATG